MASVGGDLLVHAGSERLSRRCTNPFWRSYPTFCIHSSPADAKVTMCTFVTAYLPAPTHCLCAPPPLCSSLSHRTVSSISVVSPHQRFRLPSPLRPSNVTASFDCQFPKTRSLPSPPLPPRTETASPYRQCYPHSVHRRPGGNGYGDSGCGGGSGSDRVEGKRAGATEGLSKMRERGRQLCI